MSLFKPIFKTTLVGTNNGNNLLKSNVCSNETRFASAKGRETVQRLGPNTSWYTCKRRKGHRLLCLFDLYHCPSPVGAPDAVGPVWRWSVRPQSHSLGIPKWPISAQLSGNSHQKKQTRTKCVDPLGHVASTGWSVDPFNELKDEFGRTQRKRNSGNSTKVQGTKSARIRGNPQPRISALLSRFPAEALASEDALRHVALVPARRLHQEPARCLVLHGLLQGGRQLRVARPEALPARLGTSGCEGQRGHQVNWGPCFLEGTFFIRPF